MGRKTLTKKYEEFMQIIQEKMESLDKVPEPIVMQLEKLLEKKPRIIETTEIRYDQVILKKMVQYSKNQVSDRLPMDIALQYNLITGIIQKALSKIK